MPENIGIITLMDLLFTERIRRMARQQIKDAGSRA
jgi:hypothetical protein